MWLILKVVETFNLIWIRNLDREANWKLIEDSGKQRCGGNARKIIHLFLSNQITEIEFWKKLNAQPFLLSKESNWVIISNSWDSSLRTQGERFQVYLSRQLTVWIPFSN